MNQYRRLAFTDLMQATASLEVNAIIGIDIDYANRQQGPTRSWGRRFAMAGLRPEHNECPAAPSSRRHRAERYPS